MNDNQCPACKQIIVVQGLPNGFLSGPNNRHLSFDNGERARISQCGKRTIVLTAENDTPCIDLFDRFQRLEKLLMLFDGRFYPIESLVFKESNESNADSLSEYSESLFKDRLGYYTSRDFCQNSSLKLISFQDILEEDMVERWNELLDQMDITYQVFLYCLSANKNPVDVNYAFLVEMESHLSN